MSGSQYPANFVSPVGRVPTFPEIEPDDAGDSFGYVTKIQEALDRARTAYRNREYRDAIKAYKHARSLAFTLVYPDHDIGSHVANDDVVLPVGREIEVGLAEGGLKLAESMRQDATLKEPPVQVSDVDLPTTPQAGPGYTEVEESIGPLRTELKAGLERLRAGATGEAIAKLQSVRHQLPEPTSDAERSVAAAAELNLSSAMLLEGRLKSAESAAKSARSLFDEIGDGIGVAEASHNEGVALDRLGDRERAQSAFEQARKHLDESVSTLNPSAGSSSSGESEAEDDEEGNLLGGGTVGNVSIPGPVLGGGGGSQPETAAGTTAEATTELVESSVEPLAGFSTPMEPSLDPRSLQFIEDQSMERLAVRWPGDQGWGAIPADEKDVADWQLNVSVADEVASLEWTGGTRPNPETALETVLGPRLNVTDPGDLAWTPVHPGETSVNVTHLYSFVVPKGLGECYHELGRYRKAEEYYLQAADYSYLNAELEGTNLWSELARNALEWGDEAYRNGNIDRCTEIYGKLLTSEFEVPSESPLYGRDGFAPATEAVELTLEHLDEPQSVDVDPGIAQPVLTVASRWEQLNAGLDFYGGTLTPVFTYEYLRTVAEDLAQRASQAEEQYINFTTRAEQEEATRRDLRRQAELAEKNAKVSRERWNAALDTERSMQDAAARADERLSAAREEKNEYERVGREKYRLESKARAHGARSDHYWDEITDLAEEIDSPGEYEGEHGKLAAAAVYLRGKKSYEYQLTRKQNEIDQLEHAKRAAMDRAKAADHRSTAAQYRHQAAEERKRLAEDALDAFEDETFTPEVWHRLAREMRRISRTYRDWAIEVAKEMEKAFNFENDTDHAVIADEYPGVDDADGLLGAQHLLQDITSFDYRRVTNSETKESRLTDVISLASEFPFKFYEFQRTGSAAFETDLYEFDRRHPGFHHGRVQSVEAEVIGLLPSGSANGTLRAGPVSRYRTAEGEVETRVHGVDTMALSEYDVRQDGVLFRSEPEEYGLFEGHGLGTTWRLSLPKQNNDFDYRLIQDVRLVVHYEAQYDAALAKQVSERDPRPGELVNARDFELRREFPEAWYSLLDNGSATVRIEESRLPRRQTAFSIEDFSVAVFAAGDASPAGLTLTVTPPGQSALSATTDDSGLVAGDDTNLSGAVGADLVGEWSLEVAVSEDSDLRASDGGLDADTLEDVAFLTEYAFEWVS